MNNDYGQNNGIGEDGTSVSGSAWNESAPQTPAEQPAVQNTEVPGGGAGNSTGFAAERPLNNIPGQETTQENPYARQNADPYYHGTGNSGAPRQPYDPYSRTAGDESRPGSGTGSCGSDPYGSGYGTGAYGGSTYAGNPYGGYRIPNEPPRNTYYDPGTDIPPVSRKKKKKIKETKPATKGFVLGMTAIALVIGLLLGGAGMFCYDKMRPAAAVNTGDTGSKNKDNGGTINVVYETEQEKPVITDKGDAAYVASIAADSVVEITTESIVTDSFYGNYVTQGAGSGVIISSGDEGTYIITCAHVIADTKKVYVTLKNGSKYEATRTAADSMTDVGIVKIDVAGLSVATVADFGGVVVGEGVVAIGNPLGTLGGSVTSGIVSALDRDITIEGTTYHLLQTNAEINPGNSGGGLFDMDGKLIGVVNAKSSGTNVEGLGFAIPIDDAMDVATELITHGYVTGRVKLGFQLLTIASSSDVYKYWQYSSYFTDYGVYIIESEDPQFQVGDRLIAINSTTVSSISDAKAIVQELEVGDTVKITISRLNGRKAEIMDINLVLAEAGEDYYK